VIAAVGMAMPALLRHAAQLATGYRGDRDDVDAEVLTGFLAALRERVDLAKPAPHAALWFPSPDADQRRREAGISMGGRRPSAEAGKLGSLPSRDRHRLPPAL
jgi:hypothetical protein